MLERTRIDQGGWNETLYLHTPESLGDLLTQDQTGQVNPHTLAPEHRG